MVVGAAAFVLMDDDSEDTDVNANYDGRLKVFGNANNDDWIDGKDLDALDDIIKDGWDKKENPYADANHDGKVDDKDVNIVKKMIGREPMRIWYENVDGDAYAIDYPIGNIVVIGSDPMRAMQILGLEDQVVGRNDSRNPDRYLDPTLNKTIVENAAVVTPSTSGIDIGLLTNLMNTTPVDIVVCGPGALKAEEGQLKGLGVDVVRMEFDKDVAGLNCFLTMGYLANHEEISHTLVDFYDELLADIEEKLATIPEEKRKECISMYGGGQIACNDVDTFYGSWVEKAGGINPITREMLNGEDFIRLSPGDTWHLTAAFDVEYLLHSQGLNYRYTNKDLAEMFWNQNVERFQWDKMSPTYFPDNIIMLNWNLYPPVAFAYIDSVLYEDVFGADYGDKWHQKFVDLFYSDLNETGYKVTDHAFCATYDDMKAYL